MSEAAEAERLLEAAREHKRAARRHRDRAQVLMAQLDELIAACAKRGIDIQINRSTPQSPRRHSGNGREEEHRG